MCSDLPAAASLPLLAFWPPGNSPSFPGLVHWPLRLPILPQHTSQPAPSGRQLQGVGPGTAGSWSQGAGRGAEWVCPWLRVDPALHGSSLASWCLPPLQGRARTPLADTAGLAGPRLVKAWSSGPSGQPQTPSRSTERREGQVGVNEASQQMPGRRGTKLGAGRTDTDHCRCGCQVREPVPIPALSLAESG